MDPDTAYEIRRDVELDRRLDAGLPTRSATTPPKSTEHVERARVHEQETRQPTANLPRGTNEQETP